MLITLCIAGTKRKKGTKMEKELVRFKDQELTVITRDGLHYVALKPICDALALDWGHQCAGVKSDPVLGAVIALTAITGADGKQYDMVCLPLDYLNGWLFRINAARYKGERRERIIAYQRECYRVLAEHFGAAKPKPRPVNLPMPPAERQALVDAMILKKAERMAWELRVQLARILNRGISAAELSALAFQSEDVIAKYGAPDFLFGAPQDGGVWKFPEVPVETIRRAADELLKNA